MITMAIGHWEVVCLPPYLKKKESWRSKKIELNILDWYEQLRLRWHLAHLPDGVLRLKTEEEGGGEVFNIFDTHNMVVGALLSRN